jgi:hypothetical protein
MKNKLLPDMLFPGHVWLYRRLKIYVWAALGAAIVTAWIAKAASEADSFRIFLATFDSLVLGFMAFRLLVAEAFPDTTHDQQRRTRRRHQTPQFAA